MNGIIAQRIKELEAMPIEDARRHLALHCGEVTSELHNRCSSFMAAREASLRDAREEETLSIARKASVRAERANLIAWIAAAAAITSAVTTIVVAVSK